MSKFIKAIISVSLIAMFAFTTFAQDATPKVHHRQNKQQRRIANGIKDGSLNSREAARLERQEAKIQKDKHEAKSDGTVTKEERQQLRKEQNKTSRHIYKQKHDAQHR
jgi:methionine-rich copper-binding protein CopC